MDYQNILLEIKDGIGYVTINRPDKLNALNALTVQELNNVFTKIKNDDRIFVVIVTGAGEKAFVAGADIKELHELDMYSGRDFAEAGHETMNLIENLGKPVIAAINGFALGGGCEIALACHIRLASDNAKFGQPEVNLGVIPGFGGTQRLPRLVGTGRAYDLILTGNMIDANEAFRIGLVNGVYAIEELLAAAEKLARKIMSKGQIAVSLSLDTITNTNNLSEVDGLKYEINLFAKSCSTKQFKEGTSAFLEKRSPNFREEKLPEE